MESPYPPGVYPMFVFPHPAPAVDVGSQLSCGKCAGVAVGFHAASLAGVMLPCIGVTPPPCAGVIG